ncbi:hypothetical protein KI387_024817, partial [Taxus chinensis]
MTPQGMVECDRVRVDARQRKFLTADLGRVERVPQTVPADKNLIDWLESLLGSFAA